MPMLRKLIILATFLWPLLANAQQLTVTYGTTGMQAYIGEDLWVPVAASCAQHLCIRFMHVPLATKNVYVNQRLGGEPLSPIADWDDISFLEPIPNAPLGYTSQSLLAFEDLTLLPLTPYDPYYGEAFARFKVRVVYDPSLIGQTRSDVFLAGSHPINGNFLFGDCDGQHEYSNVTYIYRSVTFLAPYAIGTGIGVEGNQQNHIDTHIHNGNSYRLEDMTRRVDTNPHGHNGQMGSDQSIATYTYNGQNPGAVITDTDNNWIDVNQRPGVDAQVYAGLFYDYLLWTHGRNSYDDAGHSLISTVECADMQNRSNWLNLQQRVAYGTSDADHHSWAGCLEVTAHEFTHGITERTSHLLYEKESGALDEAFCNMMGVTARDVIRNHPPAPPSWWEIGWHFNINGPAAIDMQSPHNTSQPDFYQEPGYWYDITNCIPDPDLNDYCGVHTNEGVPNRMFYLLAAGGQSSHNGVVVEGIGLEDAMNVMYLANSYSWSLHTNTLMKAREGCIDAAEALGGRDWEIQVANAWNAVGVCDNCVYVPGDVNNSGVANGVDVTYLWNFLFGQGPRLPFLAHCHIKTRLHASWPPIIMAIV